MSRLAVVPLGLLAVTALSCGNTTATSPSQLNLDRPTDVTFACYGGLRITNGRVDANGVPIGDPTDEVTVSAQPTPACDIRSGDKIDNKVPVPPGQEDLTAQGGFPIVGASWFAFILQTGPGTVAIARFDTKPTTAFTGGDVGVNDADPLTPGKNSISVGEEPVAIATDTTGCKVITANAGSCDLSILDIASAVDNDQLTPINVTRIDVKNAAGEPIRSKPVAMLAEPPTEAIGNACPATATGVVYIAYPSCHLVAAVDVANGTIVSGIRYTSTGPEITDGNVTCPDECAGADLTPGIRPVTIDLEKDARTAERRMVIGADNSNSLTIVELDDTRSLPQSFTQIALEETNPAAPLGVTALAISPTMGMGGQSGVLNDMGPGGQFQFVYAIATDHTIRVVDILNVNKECDTQVDPRIARDIRNVKALSCFAVDDPTKPPRRTGVKGPGIELVGDGVPLSVDIVKSPDLGEAMGGASEVPGVLVGYFAIVTATNSATFIINIDDDDHRDLFDPAHPLLTPLPAAIAHQLRDGLSNRGALARDDTVMPPQAVCELIGPPTDTTDIVTGGPRASTSPQRTIPLGVYAPEKAFELPGVRAFECIPGNPELEHRVVSELNFAAPEDVRATVFPDLRALAREEVWTATWEGTLSLDKDTSNVDGPQIREGQITVDSTNGMRIVDQLKPFCDVGVEKYDIVQLRGCDPGNANNDCPIGYKCFVHPDSQVPGLGACMLEDEADRLAEACRDFLTSVRRYTVGTTESGAIQLMPRKVTLRMTPLEGCTSDDQCKTLADYQASNASSANPVDETATDNRTWACEADPLRAPVTTGKRCMLHCDTNADCITGTICQGGGANKSGHCMESVVPPQSCVNATERYELHGGEAFVVIGSEQGFMHPIIADPTTGACIKNPAAPSNLVGRIPLTPPPCDPTANPLNGQLPGGGFEPNPCLLAGAQAIDHTEVVPLYEPGTCTLQATPVAIATRKATGIKFRNRAMNLTIVDPTYPGDQTCIFDRAGTLPGNIPFVFSGYQIGFRLIAGFGPLLLPVPPVYPVKVLKGPTNSIWVVDQGDFLSTSVTSPSTRGRVFRVEAHALGLINTLQ